VRDGTDRSGISLPQGASYATFADYDNDGWLDLFVIGGEGRGHLFRNRGNGTFEEVTAKAGIADVKGARKALFVDLDHDGDLDLLLVGSTLTVYRNNLEAAEVVARELRLRDIGGIIVIDFIDMANPKNRGTVEEALRTELERDRTKTYVVEISPLGLVEMTRQNVTDGPREVMTKKCPTCGGDGIVVSEGTAALDVERRLRALATGSRAQAYRVEVASKVASLLIGPGAERLLELVKPTGRSNGDADAGRGDAPTGNDLNDLIRQRVRH